MNELFTFRDGNNFNVFKPLQAPPKLRLSLTLWSNGGRGGSTILGLCQHTFFSTRFSAKGKHKTYKIQVHQNDAPIVAQNRPLLVSKVGLRLL